MALGLNLCVVVPGTRKDDELSPPQSERLSDAALLSPVTEGSLHTSPPVPESYGPGLRLSKSLSRSSKVCFLSFISIFLSFFFALCDLL